MLLEDEKERTRFQLRNFSTTSNLEFERLHFSLRQAEFGETLKKSEITRNQGEEIASVIESLEQYLSNSGV